MEFISNFMYKWQSLFGSMIGATVPLAFWFFIEWYQIKKKRKETLFYLEKVFVYYINSVAEGHSTIKKFVDEQLNKLIKDIEEDSKQGVYSAGITFFPLFSVHPIDENLLNISTGSSYLDNKLMRLLGMSKDYALAIEDLREQFKVALEINRQIALENKNAPEIQNNIFKENIENFKTLIERDIIEKNMKIYVELLVSSRAVTHVIREKGIFYWRYKFTPSLKYFKNKKDFTVYKEATFDRVDAFLKDRVKTEFDKIWNDIKK